MDEADPDRSAGGSGRGVAVKGRDAMSRTFSPGAGAHRRRLPAALVCVLATGSLAGALVSCHSGGGNGGASFSPRPTPPHTASFSGTPPSSIASSAESARASASAAASSASAAASAFEASVSAESARANEAAAAELKKVHDRGNALSDVSLTGKPRAETAGLLVAVVNIVNRTDKKASYAVQVDFVDTSGKTVESRTVGAEKLGPGERAQPLAVSDKPADVKLTPRVAKAQRY